MCVHLCMRVCEGVVGSSSQHLTSPQGTLGQPHGGGKNGNQRQVSQRGKVINYKQRFPLC